MTRLVWVSLITPPGVPGIMYDPKLGRQLQGENHFRLFLLEFLITICAGNRGYYLNRPRNFSAGYFAAFLTIFFVSADERSMPMVSANEST